MFLSPGEKILKYRKKYKISQEQITRGNFSNTYLGLVERGKKVLSKKTGFLIYKNLSDILKEKDILLDISYDEFIKDSESLAKEYLNKVLEERVEDNFWLVEEALLKLKSDQKNIYLKELAKYYLKKEDFSLVYKIFSKLFQELISLKKYENEFKIFLNICKKYEEYGIISFLFQKYKDEIENNLILKKDEDLNYIYLLTLLKKSYNSEIEGEINHYIKYIKSKDKRLAYYKVLIESLSKKGESLESIKLYLLSLKKDVTLEERVSILYNLLEVYPKDNKINDLKEMYLKLRQLYSKKIQKNNEEKFDTLYKLGKIALILNREKESKKYLIEALIIGKGIDVPLEQVTFIIENLFIIFEESDYYSLRSIEEEYLNILKSYKDFRPMIKLLEYYFKNYPQKLGEKFYLFSNYLE